MNPDNQINPSFDFEKVGITLTDIENEMNRIDGSGDSLSESTGLLTVKSANQWNELAKHRPIPEMLFGAFWYQGELCILFADTNLGKSILAMQIGDSISKGMPISGFQMEIPSQPVLYCDFELSDKQFENRYSKNFDEHYIFSENIFRVEINPDAEIPQGETFETYLRYSLESAIIDTSAKVLIIDNLTYLKTETEKAKDALPLMKELKSLKSKYGLSILALAHTPKRDLSKPITHNDLQGSKMLINFCDSAFSIGASSNDKSIRYLKQIKARNTEIIYDTENVCICHIEKPHNFLKFNLLNFGTEREHLKQISEGEKSEFENSIRQMLEKDPSMTAYSIAKQLCGDESKFNSFKVKVTRIVNKIRNNSNK